MSPEKQDVQAASERLKNNWIIALVLSTVATAGIVWTIAEKVAVNPKMFGSLSCRMK